MKTRQCVVCGHEFLVRRKDKRQCGVACRVRAHRIRKSASARRPRTKYDREAAGGGVVLSAAIAVAVGALNADLEQARAQLKEDHGVLERAQKIIADLRAENERQRIEFAEWQARLTQEQAEAEEERLRAALRAERAEANVTLGHAYAQVRDLRFERARAVDEKRTAEAKNTELLKEIDQLRAVGREAEAKNEELLKEIDQLGAMGRQNEQQLHAVEDENRYLWKERYELRAQLRDKTERCERLENEKEELDLTLAEAMKGGQRLSETIWTLDQELQQMSEAARGVAAQEKAARKHLAAAVESYEGLRDKYNVLVERFNNLAADSAESYQSLLLQHNTLVEDYNALVGRYNENHSERVRLANEYNARLGDLFALGERFNNLSAAYNRLRAGHSLLPSHTTGQMRQLSAENAQLRADRDWFVEQLTQKSEAIARLEAVVRHQLQAAEQRSPNRSRRSEKRLEGAKTERIAMAAKEAPSAIWGSIMNFCGGAAIGGGAAVMIQKLGAGRAQQKALPPASASDTRRLPGDSGNSEQRFLPPRK